MSEPGDPSSDCPLCGETRVQVGYESAVVAAYCEACDLLTALPNTMVVTSSEERMWADAGN